MTAETWHLVFLGGLAWILLALAGGIAIGRAMERADRGPRMPADPFTEAETQAILLPREWWA